MNGCASVCDVNLLKWAWFLCCFYRGWTGMLMLSDNRSPASRWIKCMFVCVYVCLHPCKRDVIKTLTPACKLFPYARVTVMWSHKNKKIKTRSTGLVFTQTSNSISACICSTVPLIELSEHYILATPFQRAFFLGGGGAVALPVT